MVEVVTRARGAKEIRAAWVAAAAVVMAAVGSRWGRGKVGEGPWIKVVSPSMSEVLPIHSVPHGTLALT